MIINFNKYGQEVISSTYDKTNKKIVNFHYCTVYGILKKIFYLDIGRRYPFTVTAEIKDMNFNSYGGVNYYYHLSARCNVLTKFVSSYGDDRNTVYESNISAKIFNTVVAIDDMKDRDSAILKLAREFNDKINIIYESIASSTTKSEFVRYLNSMSIEMDDIESVVNFINDVYDNALSGKSFKVKCDQNKLALADGNSYVHTCQYMPSNYKISIKKGKATLKLIDSKKSIMSGISYCPYCAAKLTTKG